MWGVWGKKRGEWGAGVLGGRFSLSSVSRAGGKTGEPRVLNVGQSGEMSWGKWGGENWGGWGDGGPVVKEEEGGLLVVSHVKRAGGNLGLDLKGGRRGQPVDGFRGEVGELGGGER